MPEFFMESKSKNPKWLPYLKEHGVVVVKNVLSQDEVKTAVDKYWQFLDKNYKYFYKKDPSKWDNDGKHLVTKDARTLHKKNWPVTGHGFSAQNYCNHSDSAWFMRTRPAVKKCF